MEITPVECHGDFYIKREDLYQFAGVRGAKVRALLELAQNARGLVSFGSRHSPHIQRVAAVAARLGIGCRLHIASGENTPMVQFAEDAGAHILRYRAGYLSVLASRAREDAQASGWTLIPFGVSCPQAVAQIRAQTANLPRQIGRLVVSVGSGTTLAGVLWGLQDYALQVPVLGVCVGKDPGKTLDLYAPAGWRERVGLVQSSLKFEEYAPEATLAEVALDPMYEAKCLPYLRSGDLLWSTGVREEHSCAVVLQ